MSSPSTPKKRIIKKQMSNDRSPKSPKIHERLFNESPSINRFMIKRTKNRMNNSKKAREDMRIIFHETDKFESFDQKTSFIIPIEITPKRPIIAMKTKIKDKSQNTSQNEIEDLVEENNLTKEEEEENQLNEHQNSTIEKVQENILIDVHQNDNEKKSKIEIIEEEKKLENLEKNEKNLEENSDKSIDKSEEQNDKFDVNFNSNQTKENNHFNEERKIEIKVNLFSDDFTDDYYSDTNETLNNKKIDIFDEENKKLKNSNENDRFIKDKKTDNLKENLPFMNTSQTNNLTSQSSKHILSNNIIDLKQNSNDHLIDKSSIRYNVEKNGGNVNGVLRFSIQWNDTEEFDANDLDAHCVEPNGNEIMYNNRASPFSRGILDIDVTEPKKNEPACENITWPILKRMQRGVYRFFVRNYEYRKGKSGFRAEIQIRDKVYSYDYRKELKDKEDVDVAEVTLIKNQFSIRHFLPFL